MSRRYSATAARGRRPKDAGFHFWARFRWMPRSGKLRTKDDRLSPPTLTVFTRGTTSISAATPGLRSPRAPQAGPRLASLWSDVVATDDRTTHAQPSLHRRVDQA